MNEQSPLFTIGHSSHSIERFIELLKLHHIDTIGDVRSSPYSRFNTQFNRETLKSSLAKTDILYVFLGKELGARRSEPECYKDNKVIYDRVARSESFNAGIQRVIQGVSKMRVALMCAEKDPLTCHRTILVARHLLPYVKQINHVLEDGSLESHRMAEERLLRECELTEDDLFSPIEHRITNAYLKRGCEIAYTEPT